MAKPTIDILIEVDRDTNLHTLRQDIENLGYIYMNYSIEPHMMFVKGYTKRGFAEKVYHIHVHYIGPQDVLLFRDYLINHPDTATEYQELKISLKDRYEYDRDAYTNAKADFINKIVELAKSV